MNSKLKKIFLISLAALIAFSSAACKKSVKVDNVSSEAVISSKPAVSEEAPVDNGIRLVISSPQKNTDYVTEPDYTFFGTSDPAEPLTVNGAAVERGEDGIFAYSVKLNVGKNVFNFEHKGETHTYTVNYRYVIIKEYTPSGAQTYPSGSTIVVNVNARRGSTVTAAFNGETITLTPEKDTDENKTDFTGYNGVIRLPSDNAQDLNLGKITYKAVHNGKTESFSSGKIICKKSDVIVDYDPNATPNGGRYMNVGSGYIAEIVEYNAETFDGNVSDASLKDGSVDWSRPTNNYLPKGTLDYCSTSLISYKETNYVTLRAGYRIYLERKDKPHTELKPVVRRYVGSLPDHNEIKVADFSEDGSHTRLTLDALWKAPFYLDILPQSYTNPAKQDYRITQATYNYIDITFCYATSFEGEIAVPESNPLFKSAEVIQNYTADGSATRDFTLRLHLKKQGAFYGWDSYYNENNQLVFEFLNPKAVTADASNEYGVNLNGAKILIDVGHGGKDSGAPGLGLYESHANLTLAFKIKAELEKMGAVVHMTRTGDTTSSTDDKLQMIRRIKPDYCIAVHHNSSNSSSPHGFGSYYSTPYSKKAAEYVLVKTRVTGIYSNEIFDWHYYFMARSSVCPVVLTENGFISNPTDFESIKDDRKNTLKAKAIARGIADYFNSIQ
mgnify:FL=1